MNLTEHFSLEELTASTTAARLGIDNTPPADVLQNLHLLAVYLEQVRVVLGQPVSVRSGYRCPTLNRAVGGSKNSQHMTGMAADIISPRFGNPLAVCRAIAKSGIVWDQVIHEGNWCHVSFAVKPRKQLLTAHFGPDGTTYTEGLVTG